MAVKWNTEEMNMMTMTGREAIEYARAHNLMLAKYTDPTEEARDGLTIEEAERIASEDPSLIYLTVA